MTTSVLNRKAVVILAAWFSALACAEETPVPTISVSGHAEIRVVPDQVSLQFGIESRAAKLTEAVKDNDNRVAKVLEFLRSLNVTERNVRTELLQLKPIYPQPTLFKTNRQANDPFNGNAPSAQESDESVPLKPVGYVVQRKLRITTNRIDQFEQIYRGLIEQGINQVDSIAFTTTKLRERRDEARVQAIRAAREKAESLAGELGAKLAGVQSITEGGRDFYGQVQNVSVSDPFGGDSEQPNRVAAGEIEIMATVHVIFRLKSTEFE